MQIALSLRTRFSALHCIANNITFIHFCKVINIVILNVFMFFSKFFPFRFAFCGVLHRLPLFCVLCKGVSDPFSAVQFCDICVIIPCGRGSSFSPPAAVRGFLLCRSAAFLFRFISLLFIIIHIVYVRHCIIFPLFSCLPICKSSNMKMRLSFIASLPPPPSRPRIFALPH